MKLVIDRKRWLRGQEDSSLYRSRDGKMCCLGFLGEACGLSQDQMADVPYPSEYEVRDYYESSAPWLWNQTYGSWNYKTLALWNDDTDLTDEQREAFIKRVFAEQGGIEVEFVG